MSEACVYLPRPARLLKVETLTAAEKLFELSIDVGAFHPEPGRFVQVTVPGVGECPISICSAPRADGRFQLCVRRVGLVTRAMHRLQPGDSLGIRGPYGRGFPLHKFLGRDLIIVAGGLGMAPLRSLVQAVLEDRSRFERLTLVYGTRSPADLLFRDEVHAWYHENVMRTIVTVDVAPSGDWTGQIGPVTVPLRRLELDPERTSAVVVGPPVMFKYVLEVLREKGLDDQHIWCSFERRMFCGIGKCGQCQIEDLLTCRDGPVLSVADLGGREEAL